MEMQSINEMPEANMSDKESNYWMIAGFAAMIVGLMYFIIRPEGIIFGIIGLSAFGIGWFRWSPLRAITGHRS